MALFRSRINVFVILKVRDLELNMCLHEAQIKLEILEKAPENVGVLFHLPSHFIKTNFGICSAKNHIFFSNVVFFEDFSYCVLPVAVSVSFRFLATAQWATAAHKRRKCILSHFRVK